MRRTSWALGRASRKNNKLAAPQGSSLANSHVLLPLLTGANSLLPARGDGALRGTANAAGAPSNKKKNTASGESLAWIDPTARSGWHNTSSSHRQRVVEWSRSAKDANAAVDVVIVQELASERGDWDDRTREAAAIVAVAQGEAIITAQPSRSAAGCAVDPPVCTSDPNGAGNLRPPSSLVQGVKKQSAAWLKQVAQREVNLAMRDLFDQSTAAAATASVTESVAGDTAGIVEPPFRNAGYIWRQRTDELALAAAAVDDVEFVVHVVVAPVSHSGMTSSDIGPSVGDPSPPLPATGGFTASVQVRSCWDVGAASEHPFVVVDGVFETIGNALKATALAVKEVVAVRAAALLALPSSCRESEVAVAAGDEDHDNALLPWCPFDDGFDDATRHMPRVRRSAQADSVVAPRAPELHSLRWAIDSAEWAAGLRDDIATASWPGHAAGTLSPVVVGPDYSTIAAAAGEAPPSAGAGALTSAADLRTALLGYAASSPHSEVRDVAKRFATPPFVGEGASQSNVVRALVAVCGDSVSGGSSPSPPWVFCDSWRPPTPNNAAATVGGGVQGLAAYHCPWLADAVYVNPSRGSDRTCAGSSTAAAVGLHDTIEGGAQDSTSGSEAVAAIGAEMPVGVAGRQRRAAPATESVSCAAVGYTGACADGDAGQDIEPSFEAASVDFNDLSPVSFAAGNAASSPRGSGEAIDMDMGAEPTLDNRLSGSGGDEGASQDAHAIVEGAYDTVHRAPDCAPTGPEAQSTAIPDSTRFAARPVSQTSTFRGWKTDRLRPSPSLPQPPLPDPPSRRQERAPERAASSDGGGGRPHTHPRHRRDREPAHPEPHVSIIRAPDLKRIGREFRRGLPPVDATWPTVLERLSVALGPWRVRFGDFDAIPVSHVRDVPGADDTWICRGRECIVSFPPRRGGPATVVVVRGAAPDPVLFARAVQELQKALPTASGPLLPPAAQRAASTSAPPQVSVRVVDESRTAVPDAVRESNSLGEAIRLRDVVVLAGAVGDVGLPPLYMGSPIATDDSLPYGEANQRAWSAADVSDRGQFIAWALGPLDTPGPQSHHANCEAADAAPSTREKRSSPRTIVQQANASVLERSTGFTDGPVAAAASASVLDVLCAAGAFRLCIDENNQTLRLVSPSLGTLEVGLIAGAQTARKLLELLADALQRSGKLEGALKRAGKAVRFRYGTPKSATTLIADALFVRYFGRKPDVVVSAAPGAQFECAVSISVHGANGKSHQLHLPPQRAPRKASAKHAAAVAAMACVFPGPWALFQVHGAVTDSGEWLSRRPPTDRGGVPADKSSVPLVPTKQCRTLPSPEGDAVDTTTERQSVDGAARDDDKDGAPVGECDAVSNMAAVSNAGDARRTIPMPDETDRMQSTRDDMITSFVELCDRVVDARGSEEAVRSFPFISWLLALPLCDVPTARCVGADSALSDAIVLYKPFSDALICAK